MARKSSVKRCLEACFYEVEIWSPKTRKHYDWSPKYGIFIFFRRFVCLLQRGSPQIRTVSGLLLQTYLCLQQRPVCASSSSNKDVGFLHVLLSTIFFWGSLTDILPLGCRWKDNCSCFRWKNNCNCFRGNKRPEGILEGNKGPEGLVQIDVNETCTCF